MSKLTWIELRKAVAAHAGATEREAAAFMNALITQIQQGLKTERVVRITDLGTFRLQEVAPRKSVDVTTGQPIVLPGYNKIVFTPEIGVKELVQTGQTEAEQQEDSPLQRLGKQADEIVAIINRDINIKNPEQPALQAQPVAKAYHFTRDLLITLSVIVLLLVGCYFLLRTSIRSWLDSKLNEVEQVVAPADSLEKLDTIATIAPIETIETIETIEAIETDAPRVYTEFIATETIDKGWHLASLARKYYGQTDLWVFIYEANREQYPNPHALQAGDKVRIPKLTKELQDLTNPATRQLVDQLIEQYNR